MQIELILFFASLAGIILMIGRKVLKLRQNFAVDIQVIDAEKFLFEIPNLEDAKYVVMKHAKRYGFIALVITLRSYILTHNFLKKKHQELTIKAKNTINRYIPQKEKAIKQKEISGFLKTISEYKQKIQKIKHRIKEEEGIK
ncbi:MAG: hypothetical protein V4439_00665 [Patescibacteria group bacterium]